jgi:hypothetical protein
LAFSSNSAALMPKGYLDFRNNQAGSAQ